jgi:hypothetical protein
MTTIIKIEITADDDTHAADVLTRLAIHVAEWAGNRGDAPVSSHAMRYETAHGEGRAVVTRA